MSFKFLVKLKVTVENAKVKFWSVQSCIYSIGVVLLAKFSIRQGQSDRMTYWKLLNQKGCKDT